MRLSYSLGSLLSIDEVISCTTTLNKYNPDTIWIPETWGMENFSMLSAIAQTNKKSKIGSSIVNIFSRSPTLIAMGAVTVDTISNGRLILGLGSSSPPIVNDFHSQQFKDPILRMKEYIEIIKLATSGKKINYSGKLFNLKNFSLLVKPKRPQIPIYLAAVNQKMLNLAWENADGVIFYLRPISELKNTVSKMQSKKEIDVACQIITCMSKNVEQAIIRAKQTLSFYISVGKVYREFLANNGFKKETESIFEEYKKSGLKSNYEMVSDTMLNALTICGTPEDCIKQLKRFNGSGITQPIIQFNPVNDIYKSFELLTSTFSGVLNE